VAVVCLTSYMYVCKVLHDAQNGKAKDVLYSIQILVLHDAGGMRVVYRLLWNASGVQTS